ncbi:MAG: hypothetical protein ABIH76_01115 [Candidatus Bathyarchaeota archaeon]
MNSNIFRTSDLKYEHKTVRLLALKRIHKMKIAGDEIESVEENVEFETKLWVADELIRNGMARIINEKEPLNIMELQKIQIKETMQTTRKLSTLQDDFYPKLRRFLKDTKNSGGPDFQKALQLATDVITCRIGKILCMASAVDPGESVLQNLTSEERVLYRTLNNKVKQWETDVLNG